MRIHFSKEFTKYLRKHTEIVLQTEQRLRMFLADTHNPLLHTHALNGAYAGCRSINITGDIRAVYEERSQGVFLFVRIGTHAELYG